MKADHSSRAGSLPLLLVPLTALHAEGDGGERGRFTSTTGSLSLEDSCGGTMRYGNGLDLFTAESGSATKWHPESGETARGWLKVTLKAEEVAWPCLVEAVCEGEGQACVLSALWGAQPLQQWD